MYAVFKNNKKVKSLNIWSTHKLLKLKYQYFLCPINRTTSLNSRNTTIYVIELSAQTIIKYLQLVLY